MEAHGTVSATGAALGKRDGGATTREGVVWCRVDFVDIIWKTLLLWAFGASLRASS